MKSRIVMASLMVLLMAYAGNGFAQKGSDLSDQFKKALTPPTSRESGEAPEKRTGATGGIVREAAARSGGEGRPSVTMHLEFKFNSDELTPQTVKYLHALGTALQDPVLSGFVYKVEGHTDGVGGDSYNLELSRRRAAAVADYMVKTFGLEEEQFESEGCGKTRPVALNDTEQGRRQNRRVVIINTL